MEFNEVNILFCAEDTQADN